MAEHGKIETIRFSPAPADPLHEAILKQLKAANIQLTTSEETTYQLSLATPRWSSHILAYGPDGRPVREAITLETAYTLIAPPPAAMRIEDTLSITRQRQLDPRQVLADNEEKHILQAEMQHDAAYQMLQRLFALNWQTP